MGKQEYVWNYTEKGAYNNRTGRYKTKAQLNFILRSGVGKFNKILDIAGGAGRFAVPLVEYSKNITVNDINEKAIQLLKERNADFKTICGDFSKIEINDTFSLIICIEAIPYFQDWEAFFNKIHFMLEKDGRFVFTHNNLDSWRYIIRKLRFWKKTSKYNTMKLNEFKELLTKCNFEIDQVEGMNWIPLSVTSNSILVNFFSFIERTFKLYKWHSQSPWLLMSIKKAPEKVF